MRGVCPALPDRRSLPAFEAPKESQPMTLPTNAPGAPRDPRKDQQGPQDWRRRD